MSREKTYLNEQVEIVAQGLTFSAVFAFVKKWRTPVIVLAVVVIIGLGFTIGSLFSWRASLRAADAGELGSQMHVARIFYDREEYETSAYWYKRAVDDNDYLIAKLHLAEIHGFSRIANPDKELALSFMAELAEAHHTEAQLRLSNFYYYGDVVEQDYEKAYWWADIAQHNKHRPGGDDISGGIIDLVFTLNAARRELTEEQIATVRLSSLQWREQFPDHYYLTLTTDSTEDANR